MPHTHKYFMRVMNTSIPTVSCQKIPEGGPYSS